MKIAIKKTDKNVVIETPIPLGMTTAPRLPIDLAFEATQNYTGACLEYISKNLAGLQWNVYYKGEIAPPEHWLTLLVKKPNALMTWFDITKLACLWYYSNGSAYLHALLNSSGKPAALNVFASNTVKPKFTNFGITYEINDGGMSVIDSLNMISIINFEPAAKLESQFYGRSIVQKAWNAITSDNRLTSYIHETFANGGTPPLVIEAPGAFLNNNSESQNQFKTDWRQRNPNIKLLGIMQDGAKLAPIQGSAGISLNTNLIPAVDDIIKENISVIFGVPKGVLTGDNANFATADVNAREFKRNTISPLAKKFQDSFNHYFQQFDPDVELLFEPFIFVDKELEMKEQAHRLSFGLANRNQILEEQGFKAIENGERYFIQSNLISVDNVLNPPAPMAFKILEKKKNFDDLTENDKYEIWKKHDDFATSFVPKIQKDCINLIDDIEKDCLNRIKADTLQTKQSFFDVDKFKKKLKDYFGKDYEDIISRTVEISLQEIGLNPNEYMTSFEKLISETAIKNLKVLENSIDTFDNQLFKAATDNPDTLLKEILMNKFMDFKGVNSKVIAETAVVLQRTTGQILAWDEVGGYDYVWLSMRDAKVRDSHKAADGQIRGADGYFNVGGSKMNGPGSGLSADEVIRCRCVMIPQLKKQ